ncbi:hypothetical protein THF1C08_390025 [Vibrio jasicida]|uniref:Uncharacterized protein n=1 Tax=Vibrio jasicida TaxID=766224 RepID=A0AAU9QQS2_9VIBR|nr:hypothetical protein THF1C08_390025 [Vibrio jasicida]CAH1598976.1 hypothetical protein THF1A12_390025 [Vibrio jasicida]
MFAAQYCHKPVKYSIRPAKYNGSCASHVYPDINSPLPRHNHRRHLDHHSKTLDEKANSSGSLPTVLF